MLDGFLCCSHRLNSGATSGLAAVRRTRRRVRAQSQTETITATRAKAMIALSPLIRKYELPLLS